MAKKFRDLTAKMTVESRIRAEERARDMLAEMPLHELRQARHMTQETMADALGASQASVSKMERRTDVYVSTLRRYIEAMGGELEIRARFPEGDVRINQFRDLDETDVATRSR
ncbi:MAG TPA: XRE family transcriptional regulator [Longimicrobiaceae bacterium]|nr:XRE family transcriptional regulator [Longimicrobiaceae bacterium]